MYFFYLLHFSTIVVLLTKATWLRMHQDALAFTLLKICGSMQVAQLGLFHQFQFTRSVDCHVQLLNQHRKF